jgi:hypothetical protein
VRSQASNLLVFAPAGDAVLANWLPLPLGLVGHALAPKTGGQQA